jgi:hypothetical protein
MKRGFRFSLLALFLLMTIAALAIALIQARTRLGSLEVEVDRLRKEAGFLSISDPDKVHVIAVPRTDPMTWRWRVYLPGGQDFGIYSNCGKLDAKGLPATGRSSGSRIGGQSNPREPREILIDVAYGKNIDGDPCLHILENGRGFKNVIFDGKPPSWLDAMFSEKVAGQRTVVSADSDTPLALIALDGAQDTG